MLYIFAAFLQLCFSTSCVPLCNVLSLSVFMRNDALNINFILGVCVMRLVSSYVRSSVRNNMICAKTVRDSALGTVYERQKINYFQYHIHRLYKHSIAYVRK